jgi:hypothetical protein
MRRGCSLQQHNINTALHNIGQPALKVTCRHTEMKNTVTLHSYFFLTVKKWAKVIEWQKGTRRIKRRHHDHHHNNNNNNNKLKRNIFININGHKTYKKFSWYLHVQLQSHIKKWLHNTDPKAGRLNSYSGHCYERH